MNGKWFQPGSLRYQLLLRSIILLAVILIIIGLMQDLLMKDFLYRNKAETLLTQLMSLPPIFFDDLRDDSAAGRSNTASGPDDSKGSPRPEAPGGSGAPGSDRPRDRQFLVFSDTSLATIEEDGTFTDQSGETGLPSPQLTKEEYSVFWKSLKKQPQKDYVLVRDPAGSEQLVVFRKTGPPGRECLIQIGVLTSTVQDVIVLQLLIFASLSALALSIGAALYWPVLRRTLVPLSRIVMAVEQTDAGNLTERLPTRQGQQEIDRLSVSFNGMLERLETSFEAERAAKERMRQFVADASHELRTPLTSIHGFLEVLLRGAAPKPEQLRGALISMHAESKRINKLVADLLLLAKLDHEPQLLFAETRLNELIVEMQPQLRLLGGDRNVSFELKEAISVTVDTDKIKQVVLNLFHNAVQHTDPDKGNIAIILEKNQHHAVLSVRDNGSGIPGEQMPRLFERFHRNDSSRTRKYGGAGLGLSISKAIMKAHGGDIEAENRLGGGAIFRVILPLHESNQS